MKKLSSTLVSLAAISFSTLPAQAVNEHLTAEQNIDFESAQEQIQNNNTVYREPFCFEIPGWGLYCF